MLKLENQHWRLGRRFAERPTRGFAILGQKQYTAALVHYWASARAEVFSAGC
jgi:hypothetical protein